MATPGALEQLRRIHSDPLDWIRRHQHGDWGDVDPQDRAANEQALQEGHRLLSAYCIHRPPHPPFRLWIITEADRSTTTLLLPEEY
jgi:hypothetical protein